MQEPMAVADTVARQVVDAALAVHRVLGPGLLESVYEQCLAHELMLRGVAVRRQAVLPVTYRDLRIEGAFRVDLIADDQVIVEIKAVEHVMPVHSAQLLSYLKLSGLGIGLLINFNVPLLKQGIRRIVHSPGTWRP